MANIKYRAEDWAEVDGLLYTTPICDIVNSVPMSKHTLRMRCKRLGISPVMPRHGRAYPEPEDMHRLMMSWGRP